MTKIIKTVETVLAGAFKSGHAKRSHYEAFFDLKDNTDTATLYFYSYGTLIGVAEYQDVVYMQFPKNDTYTTGYDGELVYAHATTGAYSPTDRDALGTFFETIGVHRQVSVAGGKFSVTVYDTEPVVSAFYGLTWDIIPGSYRPDEILDVNEFPADYDLIWAGKADRKKNLKKLHLFVDNHG